MPQMIFMQHVTFEYVGLGLELAVRVRRKTGDVLLRPVTAELIEHQEGIKSREQRLAETAIQRHPRSVGGTL